MEVVIVVPVYNDWDSLLELVRELRAELRPQGGFLHLVVVNDGSTLPAPDLPAPPNAGIHLLNLTGNFGHQRAIITGLCYAAEVRHRSQVIVVMDADGEDRPADIPPLLTASTVGAGQEVVTFASREERSESLAFRIGYRCYRWFFWLLSGKRVKFGNFSCIPVRYLGRITHNADFWNHYVAALLKSGIPYQTLPTRRGRRYAGRSSMRIDDLILHGAECCIPVQ